MPPPSDTRRVNGPESSRDYRAYASLSKQVSFKNISLLNVIEAVS